MSNFRSFEALHGSHAKFLSFCINIAMILEMTNRDCLILILLSALAFLQLASCDDEVQWRDFQGDPKVVELASSYDTIERNLRSTLADTDNVPKNLEMISRLLQREKSKCALGRWANKKLVRALEQLVALE